MSGKHHDPEQPGPEEELESLLKQLQPAAMDVGQTARLLRDYDRIAVEADQAPSQVRRKRVIPLAFICCLLIGVFGYIQFGSGSLRQELPPKVADLTHLDPIPMDSVESRLVPVSAHGYVVNTSSNGVIHTKDGPREQMNVNYEDAYHWHDPKTGTNIRVFTPRNEQIIVPLQVD
tara:strand:+ start:150 stop:674 length:525 start_codon:yes stop_codon:yes gene_type:complete